MVLRKKNITSVKNAQARKKEAFDVDNGSNSDFAGDSGEEMVVQKTPKNKTPQGRNSQSMSAKKVSFEVSGKKTPGKIPQKNNSFIGKKQPTPVPKGMKGNKGVQKKRPQSVEIDDDDDDDDDFELDMDEDDSDDNIDDDEDEDDDDEEEEEQIQKQKSNSKQLTKLNPKQTPKGKNSFKEPLGEEMDDEEEEDRIGLDIDNIDMSDDDEHEEGEEQAQIQRQKSNSKQQRNDIKTQIKDADKSEEQQMPESKREWGTKKNISDGEWDLTLFVGNLPIDVTLDELKDLSSDISDIIIPKRFRRFALILFASEEKADANYKTLQGKELRGHLLNIDYMGAKSKHLKIKEEQNLKSLLVRKLPAGVTSDELKALSSDIEDVYIGPVPQRNCDPYAFIRFASEEKADANYKALQGVKLKGQVVSISYVGQKASKMASSKALQLYIRGIPLSATLGDVATHFPKATQVSFNKSTGLRTAFVRFFKQEDAAEAFNLKEIEIDGHMLKLNEFGSASNSSSKNMREGFKKRNFKYEDKPAKKRKFFEKRW